MEKCIDCGGKLSKKNKTNIKIAIPPHYGLIKLTKKQKELFDDVLKLISTKYLNMGIDECMLVFSRVYGAYMMADLKDTNKIKFIKKKEYNIKL